MELIQINWDPQENLFLKFKKGPEEVKKLSPDNITRINLQYNISKIDAGSQIVKTPPFWFSIKKPYFSNDAMGIAVELEEIQNYEELQIEIMKLKITYVSGEKEFITINEKIPLEEIFTNDACYLEFPKKQHKSKKTKGAEITIKQKRSIKITTMDLVDFEEKQINTTQSRQDTDNSLFSNKDLAFPISKEGLEALKDIKGDKSWTALLYIIGETFKRLNYVEEELRETNATLREVALKNAEALCSRPTYISPPPPVPSSLNPPQASSGPPKRRLSSGAPKNLIKDPSSSSLQAHTEVIREMQEKFKSISDVKQLLNQVPEEVLKQPIPRTDRAGFLEFKQKKMERKEKI